MGADARPRHASAGAPPPGPRAGGAAGPHAPRTILFAHGGRDWIRGSERCLLDLLERIDRARFRAVVWCDAPTLAAAAAAVGAEVYLAPTAAASAGAFPVDRALTRVARELVARHGVRLIHANAGAPLPSLVVAARAARVPLVAHLHLIPDEAERRWTGFVNLPLAERALGTSAACRPSADAVTGRATRLPRARSRRARASWRGTPRP